MPAPAQLGLHKRTLLRDDVYSSLRDAIVDGTFAPGERLKDPELEEWLGVSRTPIREALLRLERAGLVLSQPGKSTIVAPYDAEATANAQQVTAAMHELAARSAMPTISDAQVQEMADANIRFAAALDAQDADAALVADDEFHAVFVEASGNPMIASILEQATPLLRRIERMRFSSTDARESVAKHEAIIATAREGDTETVAALCRENWLALSFTL
jgi:DNA-binding GntR family transcriptional regulator